MLVMYFKHVNLTEFLAGCLTTALRKKREGPTSEEMEGSSGVTCRLEHVKSLKTCRWWWWWSVVNPV
jgi:hypothetical protein